MTTLDSQSDKSLCHLDKLQRSDNVESSGCSFPDGLSPLDFQMAGHPFDGKKHTIGMLRRRNGHVLKPATKAILGEREIAFYENLQTSGDATITQLKNFVPRYYGTMELQVFDKRIKFLALKDITEGMVEPCVMDIKIGRRTWDPLATPEKRATEEFKYAESKRAYGFCITGFQVYCLSTGRLKKFDRDYGKKLDAKGVVEALEAFLNVSPERPPCRQLIVNLLSFLWKMVEFFRTQRRYRFYSSSLLVAYDAATLRNRYRVDCDDPTNRRTEFLSSTSPVADGSAISPNAFQEMAADQTKDNETNARSANRMLKRSVSLNAGFASTEKEKICDRSGSCSPDLMVDRPCRTHSYANSFDNVASAPSKDNSDVWPSKRKWVRVNMIDFTHVFPADDENSLDLNYLQGIENLMKLLESFLPREDASK